MLMRHWAAVARRIENCDAVIRVYDEAGNVIETRSPFRSRRSAKKRTHTLNWESVFE
jgi:hypothetical protein